MQIERLFVYTRIYFFTKNFFRFFNFIKQFPDGTDTFLFFPVFGSPDWQGSSPKPAAAQVPVHHILQPVTKSPFTSGGRFPLNGFIEFHHSVFNRRRFDEPGIQWIIQNGFICSPAVRVGMFVFFDFKCAVFFLEFYTDVHIYIHIMLIILIIFYIAATEFIYSFHKFSLLVHEYKNPEFILFSYFIIIRSKIGGYMNDPGSVFGGYKIPGNNPERICVRSDDADFFKAAGFTGYQLIIMAVFQPGTGK